jgi:small nuclear ribonucleoprotein B and B'
MLGLINWRLKVTINDGRAFIGQMLAFDRHMNLVLADCEEFRRVRPKKKPGETEAGPEQEMKRSLGLVILRGETVVSLSVEGPPPVQDDDKKNAVCATLFFIHPSHLLYARPLAPCWPGSRDAGWAGNGNGASRSVLYSALGISIEDDRRSRLQILCTDSGTSCLRETSDAICATRDARRTSWLPSPRIPARRAFPPSSRVRRPSPSWVRRSPDA